MKPKQIRKKPGEYDHAQGCPNSVMTIDTSDAPIGVTRNRGPWPGIERKPFDV